MCGGTSDNGTEHTMLSGLSPRVRGNPCRGRRCPMRTGSIPACAGEPRNGVDRVIGVWVYPRVCGGTSLMTFGGTCPIGLSPRVRGNRRRGYVSSTNKGSIPACAGEPCTSTPFLAHTVVYPRVCGGTSTFGQLGIPVHGLSPRVRGNPRKEYPFNLCRGSIPACAGEPSNP